MAGTIISTPAVGSSDWTDWIIQQGLTDRGYMRVSLTNFASTAASAIGTGSVMEVAGSIYQFTETAMSLAAGTASASVAIYFIAIPSAGGTAVTISMDSTAPTWVDAKQGFYASAASTSRYLGGAYIGTAATYFNKWIYHESEKKVGAAIYGGNLDIQNGIRTDLSNGQPYLKKTIIEIGDWNMSATTSINKAHGMSAQNIRGVDIIIRHDNGTNLYSIYSAGGTGDGRYVLDATDIAIFRTAGGAFNNNSFDSTSFNRGWITIVYEA